MSLKTLSTMATMMVAQMSSTNLFQWAPRRLRKKPRTRKIGCKRRRETSLKTMGMLLKKIIMTLPIRRVVRASIRNRQGNLKLWILDISRRLLLRMVPKNNISWHLMKAKML
jgi:hypothetical protein